MAKVLTGQAARDYLKKNPNATYKAYDSSGQEVASKEQDRGFFGGLWNGLTKPLADFGNAVGGAYEDQSQPSKYLTSDQQKKLIENPAAYIGQKGLGAASTLIPFGGGVKTAAAVGGASGLADADLSNPSDIAGKVATGAVGGGLFAKAMPLVGKAFGGLGRKVAPEATKVGNVVDDGLDDVFREVEKSFSKTGKDKFVQGAKDLSAADLGTPMGKYEANPIKTQRTAQGILRKYGLKEDLDGVVQGKERIGQQMESYIDEIVRKNPKQTFTADKMFNEDFTNQLDNLIDTNKQITPEKLRATAAKFLNQGKYGEVGGVARNYKGTTIQSKDPFSGRSLTIGDLKQSLQDINMGIQSGSLKGTEKRIAELIKGRIYETLGESAPKYKGLARGYAVLSSVENPTAEIVKRGQRTASTDPFKEIQGKLYNAAKKKVGQAGEFIANPKVSMPKSQAVSDNLQRFEQFAQGKGIPQTKIAQLAGSQIALEMFDADGNGQLDEQEMANAENAGMGEQGLPSEGSQLDGGMDINGDGIQDSPEAVYNDAFKMYLSVSGDPISARKQAAALVGFDPNDEMGGGASEMTAKMKEQKAALSDSEKQLVKLGEEAAKFQSEIPLVGGLLGMNPWDSKRKGYLTRLKATLQNVAKGMEGGKLTDADREYYLSFLPNEDATAQAFAEQIAVLQDMVASKKAALGE